MCTYQYENNAIPVSSSWTQNYTMVQRERNAERRAIYSLVPRHSFGTRPSLLRLERLLASFPGRSRLQFLIASVFDRISFWSHQFLIAPVFDRISFWSHQFLIACCSMRSKTGGGNGLGTRLRGFSVAFRAVIRPYVIKGRNWRNVYWTK